jgi:CheY-like chemotaxis protein
LGLAIVRHLVELHGGTVAAESGGIGKGATFTVSLPIRAVLPGAPEPIPSSRPLAESVPRSDVLTGFRVLVVDDEEDARDMVATVLLESGAEVQTASSAAEALQMWRRFRPDVLVSDIGMPDEDGFSFIRKVRALPKSDGGKIPSLALTAFAREEDRTRALSAGYTTHIGKPVDPDALVAAVANLAALVPGAERK